MTKLVVLKLGKGNFNKGFPAVTVQLWEDLNGIPIQFTGSLPAAPQLIQLYRRWQLLYNLLYEAVYGGLSWRRHQKNETGNIEIDEDDITNVSSIEFSQLCEQLESSINSWFKSRSFSHIDQKIRTKLAPTDEIRVIFETDSDQVRRLPWHLWNFFADYKFSVLCLSSPEFEQVKKIRKSPGTKIRILAILGNSEGIDIQKDRGILAQLPGSETIFLVEPERQELDFWLWDKQGWDILFFAGHSASQDDGETGRIYINKTDSLTIPQLKNALLAALDNGLRLAIFNSCDGLGLACQLACLHIPQMIVMREPVPDAVAQKFLKDFLETFADGESFYLAARHAQSRLQGLEGDFPCASWLPVIFQNPAEAPLVWSARCLRSDNSILPKPRIISLLLQTTVLITAVIMAVQGLGILQPAELSSYDTLMRLRPQEQPDQRILVVRITEADVQAQPANERKGASLSDSALAELVRKLEQFQPSVIGLDIYRENPVQTSNADLAATMLHSDRFIAICKAGEENKNSGVPAPPEVPVQRLGFSDVVPDDDGVLRRQLLAMAAASPCETDKSFSFQLATAYLANFGIHPQLNLEKNWQFGNVVFPNLDENSGGYNKIDNLGHQVLLNYRASNSVAAEVTLTDVFNNQLTPDLVKNRIVLIGTTAESFHDSFSTPYSAGGWPHESMPGVVIQAHMVSQILSAVLDNRPLLSVLPKWCEALGIWCWSAIGVFLAWCLRSRLHQVIGVITAIAVLSGLCLGLLIQGAWIPLIPPLLALITTSGCVLTYIGLQTEKE